jgi:catechol 2,3-dioxygenase-like lactoylglutathione lyase family enzyme
MTQPMPVAFHHTCFVVRDLEATARAMSKSFGIGPWNVWTIAPAEARIRGVVTPFSFRVALAQVGGAMFELIAPDTGASLYEEQLAARGEGFHHTCFTYESIGAARAATAALVAEGREVVCEGETGDVFYFAYIDYPELASPVEVLFLDASQLPPPEATI